MIAIDLGSNTLRGIVYDDGFKQSFETMVKTAENLSRDGVIGEPAIERIVKALKEMDGQLSFSEHDVVAKTTAALRMARNSEAVLALIKEQTGVLFEVISGEREAYYTQLAVRYRLKHLDIERKSFVLLDVGGGSTELIICRDEVKSISVNVGIVTMAESFTDKESLIKNLYKEFEVFRDFIAKEDMPKLLISTAGTPTTMASMKHKLTVESYDPCIVNGTTLTRDDMAEQLQRLLDMDEKQRALHVGVGRDTLIITGVEILRVLLDILHFDSMLVIDDGMREGIAIDFIKNV